MKHEGGMELEAGWYETRRWYGTREWYETRGWTVHVYVRKSEITSLGFEVIWEGKRCG